MMSYRSAYDDDGTISVVHEGEELPDTSLPIPNLYMNVQQIACDDELLEKLSHAISAKEAIQIICQTQYFIELRHYFRFHAHFIRSVFDSIFERAILADLYFGTPIGIHPLDLCLCSLLISYHLLSPNKCEIRVREFLEILDFDCFHTKRLFADIRA